MFIVELWEEAHAKSFIYVGIYPAIGKNSLLKFLFLIYCSHIMQQLKWKIWGVFFSLRKQIQALECDFDPTHWMIKR